MASNEILIDRIRAVNPIPNDGDETTLSATALLAAVDERSGVMKTGSVETVAAKPAGKKRRNGLLVGAAAFVAVLLLGVALLALSRDEGDTPPATEQPPTTQAAPPTTQVVPTTSAAPTTTAAVSESDSVAEPGTPSGEDLALIASFVAAYNAGDVDATMSFIAPTTLYWDFEIGVAPIDPPPASTYGDSLRLGFEFGALLERSYSLQECSQFEGGPVVCSGSISDTVVAQAVGGVPTTMRFDIADGGFSLLTVEIDPGTYLFAWAEFFDWLSETHPDEMTTLEWSGSLDTPKYTEETLPLWEQRVADYAATFEG